MQTNTSTHTKIIDRPLASEADALHLRQLLIDTYALVGREFNWETRRWEGTYWCISDAQRANPVRDAGTHLWENANGEIVGAIVLDGPGDVALQVHPAYRDLEDTMLAWAEAHLAHLNASGERELIAWAFDWDTNRQDRLARRGYILKPEWFWHNRRRAVHDPVPAAPLAEGYCMRSVYDTDEDGEQWVTCSNTVFGQAYRVDFHRNFQHYAPSHNYDLHLVAEAPDGTVAAFAGLTVDVANRTAVFEPVGTHPDHRRKGLARVLVLEGIRRLQALGTADTVYVANWGTADAAKLYASVGLQHYATTCAWVKTL